MAIMTAVFNCSLYIYMYWAGKYGGQCPVICEVGGAPPPPSSATYETTGSPRMQFAFVASKFGHLHFCYTDSRMITTISCYTSLGTGSSST